jgi:hypothetical protein
MSKTPFAIMLLLAATFVGAPTAAKAQVNPEELRGVETEEEFRDEQRAIQADEEDNDPANAQRLMILDSRGRPYMYDGVRDGIVCRAQRVKVATRRNAFGEPVHVYKKSVRCNSR